MNNQQRTSCIDPLPICEESCDRILSCGPIEDHHRCSAQCHNGPCPPCDKQSNLQCRCGQLTKLTSCIEAITYDPIKNPFLCERRCNRKKLCGKHRCTELCCDRDIHVCEVVCGKTLSCGIHKCEELCHKNLCRKCPINIYEELTCRCGQTVLQPPFECGTEPPLCNYRCNRTHTCDHPVYHSCHNEEHCPPCAYLVSKMCVGEHTMRNSVPCHLKEVLCGQPCGKPLPCGVHTCQRACHSGSCQTSEQKCTQRCDIKRRECGHPCNVLCHGHDPCPITTCREIIKVQCPCGRLVKDIVCNVKSSEPNENIDNVELTQSLVQALSVRTIDLSLARKQQPVQQQQLECDDECRILQRNKNLAQALDINLEEPRATTIVYTDFLRDYAKKNLEFVQTIERQFTQLVEDTRRYAVKKRCHTFKPMKINERHVIHELATFYGLETQAMDPEPQRNVVAFASYNMCKIPSVTLSETIRREKLKVPPPVTLK
jgi:transcriptional repressor NF-X1